MEYDDYGVGQLELANKRTRDFRGMAPGAAAAQQQMAGGVDSYTRALRVGANSAADYSPPRDLSDQQWNQAIGTMPSYDAPMQSVPPATLVQQRPVEPPTLHYSAPRRDAPRTDLNTVGPLGRVGSDMAAEYKRGGGGIVGGALAVRSALGGAIGEAGRAVPDLPDMSRVVGAGRALFTGDVPDAASKAITVPQYASDADERGSYEPVQFGGERGPPSPEYAGYAQGGTIGERRNYTAQDLAQMGGAAPAGGMTTEQANNYYGGMNRGMSRLQRANELQNHDEAQRQANLSARSIGDRIAAENATWAAKVDASSIVGGRGARAKSALSADVARNARGVANASQTAVDSAQGPNYVGQAAAMNAQELQGMQGRREYLAEQQAQQNLATGRQGQELGSISIEQHKTQQRLLAAIEKADTPDKRQAAISAYYASVQKEPPKPEPIVHGAAEYTKPGEISPTKETYFATRDATGKMQIIKAGGDQETPTKERAVAEAQAALKAGASKEAINARLKQWGYPPL